MLSNDKHLAELNSPVQRLNARVELHNGSTLVQICTCGDYLKDLNVERVGAGKFFGYGICHKLIVNFIDPNRELNLTDVDFMEVTFGADGDFIYPFPTFHVLEVNRDETTNELSVVAYDKLYQSMNYTVSDLSLPKTYNILYFIASCAALLGMSVKLDNVDDVTAFMTEYANGANFDGNESIRQALDAVAEVTQTIYYVNGDWQLTFKRLDQSGDPVSTVNKDQYIELKSGANCTLGAIAHTTELGDSITATYTEDGVTQYLRDNPFLELRDDAWELLNNGIATVGGSTINPFECSWIGNYLLEIGDKIAIIAEDNREIVTYIVDDSITFDGTLGQFSRWEFVSDGAENANNPTSLGDSLNQTFARVDKVNKRIDLVVIESENKFSALEITTDGIKGTVSSMQTEVDDLTTRMEKAETSIEQTDKDITLMATKTELEEVDGKVTANRNSIAALQINAESITASVKSIETTTQEQIDSLNDSVETLTKQASLSMTAEDVQIAIETELDNGVEKVTTKTGFTFNDDGLTVSKSDSEMTTQITEDGMTVFKNDDGVLVANNEGVTAVNLHATTYLIIGNQSRFESYDGGRRTACYWIGR